MSFPNDTHPAALSFITEERIVPRFFYFLQNGFMVRTASGCSIRKFLCKQMGLNAEYVMNTITTIILDGKPVDDIDDAMLREGSVLALSAAMPGLVGATMRRAGLFSGMRSSITYREDHNRCSTGDVTIILKLFNLLLEELGPDILARGIYVTSSSLKDFLKSQTPEVWQDISQVFLDGKPFDIDLMQTDDWISREDILLLTVRRP